MEHRRSGRAQDPQTGRVGGCASGRTAVVRARRGLPALPDASAMAGAGCALPVADRARDPAPAVRHGLVAMVLMLHVLVAWMVLHAPTAPLHDADARPLFASLIQQALPTPPTPQPQPAPPPSAPKRPSAIAAPVPDAAQPQTLPTPEAPPEPAPEVRAEPSAAMPSATPAPAAPVAAPAAAAPRVLPSSAVRYLVPPAPVYPVVSRRLGEAGEVDLKVLIGIDGRARHVSVQRSSGHPRLDDSAVEAVREARFIPYTEHGEAVVAWTVVPIVFHLEN